MFALLGDTFHECNAYANQDWTVGKLVQEVSGTVHVRNVWKDE